MRKRKTSPLPLIVVVLAALAAAAPVWGPGLVNTRGGGDSPFLLQRTHQLVENLRAGVVPARWMPDGAYGLGYPFYNYYSVLPFYFAALLALLGLDILSSIQFVQTLGFMLAAVAMYGWARRLFRNRWAACLGSVAYVAAPFHMVNVYVRGDSLSEFFAFGFYPLVLWGVERMVDRRVRPLRLGRWTVPFTSAWVWPGIAYAGLIVTHNISALIFSPFILLDVALLLLRNPGRRRYLLTTSALALGCGLLVSAWAWVPALAETRYVQAQTLTDDYFHYSRHYRTIDLVQRTILFNYSVAPGRDTPFAMGLAQAVFGLLGGIALCVARLGWLRWSVPSRPRGAGAAFLLLGLSISTAMITPASGLLWDNAPLLPMIQFPWRFLSVQSVFVATCTAALALMPARSLAVGLSVGIVLLGSVLLRLRPDRLPIGPDDVTEDRIQIYELFTQNIGTTIRHEWLPQAAVPRPFTSDALIDPTVVPAATPLDGSEIRARLVDRGPTHQRWLATGDGGRIAFPVLYWPGWGAEIEGVDAPIVPVRGSGLIAVEVPPGDSLVLLRLGRTRVRWAAEVVSALAVCGVLAACILLRHTLRWRRPAAVLGAVVAPSVMALLLPTGIDRCGAGLTMDFDQAPYLHCTPGGVPFRNGPRLASVSLSASEMEPGEVLGVALEWSDVAETYTGTLRLLSPAALRRDTAPLAETTQEILAGQEAWLLTLPDETPRGTYLLELRVYGVRGEVPALTPAGRTRGSLCLMPVRVPEGPLLPDNAPILAPFGPAIRLHRVSVAPAGMDALRLELDWSAVYALASNYGISLRILDADDRVLRALDTQPGYGYLPTSTWRPGELVTDQYLVVLHDPGVTHASCSLHVILYHVSTGAVIGEGRFGAFDLPMDRTFAARAPGRVFILPEAQHETAVTFGQEIELVGYDLDDTEAALALRLWWRALSAPSDDYTVFVHLFRPAGSEILVQSDTMPRAGSYPTSWWAAGEVVSDSISLPLDSLPPGTYSVAVGLYDRTLTRLHAESVEGGYVSDNRVLLDAAIEVE